MPKDFLTSFTRASLSSGSANYLNRLINGQKIPKGNYADRHLQPLVKQLGLTDVHQLKLVFLSRGFESLRDGFHACKNGNDLMIGLMAAKKFSERLQYDRLSPQIKEKLNEICPRLLIEKNPAIKNKLMRESFVMCAAFEKNILHMLKKDMQFGPDFVNLIFNVGLLKAKVHRLMMHPELREIDRQAVKVTIAEKLIFKMTPVQLEEYEKQTETKLKQLEFLTPSGDRSSGQGVRQDPFNKRKVQEHQGIDYGAMHGSPVDSAYPGKVVSIDTVGRTGYGKYVVVMTKTPKGNFYTLYGHLSGIDVEMGQNIKLGQPMARVGSTGHSTAPHLHIEKRSENTFSQGRGEYLEFTELKTDSQTKKI